MDEKYIDLFTSGKSRQEIEEELVEADEFFLSNFPQVFRDALQVCCVSYNGISKHLNIYACL